MMLVLVLKLFPYDFVDTLKNHRHKPKKEKHKTDLTQMPVTIPAEDIAARIAQLEAKKARRTKQAAATPTPVPKTDVDRCDHLSVRSVLYHSAWSGEFDTFRNGVLTHGQAWGIVCMALLLPCLGGGGTSTCFQSKK